MGSDAKKFPETESPVGVDGVERLRVARGFFARLRGLMFEKDLPRGEALLIPRCSAVHTCFMRFPLDLVFLDADGRAVKTVRDVKPWRVCVFGGRRAKSVVEAKAGWLLTDRGGTALGNHPSHADETKRIAQRGI